ncbi:MAG: NUDIX hydrolase [Kocuria sp.]|nr:NUDIX hydrolase [Kocuria sp.]MDN5616758.1 NUDIX hydrolase [Kocuria sp.]
MTASHDETQTPDLSAIGLPQDRVNPRKLISRETAFEGQIFDVVRETFALTEGGDELFRDYMRHPGAVAIAALNENNEILLINQYRQPVEMNMWEIPAGLLDVEGESPLAAAQRELAEETDLKASTWHTLAEFNNSPGCSTEANRIFLARGINDVAEEDLTERTDEEAEIVKRWVPMEEAVSAVLATGLHSPTANIAILATWASIHRDHADLRDPEEPWPAHKHLRESKSGE